MKKISTIIILIVMTGIISSCVRQISEPIDNVSEVTQEKSVSADPGQDSGDATEGFKETNISGSDLIDEDLDSELGNINLDDW